MQCLSAFSPCDEFRATGEACEVCKMAYNRWLYNERERRRKSSIDFLTKLGYTITGPEESDAA